MDSFAPHKPGGSFDDFVFKLHCNLLAVIVRLMRWHVAECSVNAVGHHSWWSASRGSWFIESLCQELSEAMSAAAVIDIEQVMTRARFQVAYNQETSSSNEALTGKKQMPALYSTLTKQLHFPSLHWTACSQFVCTLLPSIYLLLCTYYIVWTVGGLIAKSVWLFSVSLSGNNSGPVVHTHVPL